jgi:hypothetical protein
VDLIAHVCVVHSLKMRGDVCKPPYVSPKAQGSVKQKDVRFEVFTAVTMKNGVL